MRPSLLEQLLTIRELPRIGRKTAYKIINNLNHDVDSLSTLFEIIQSISKPLKLPPISLNNWNKAISQKDKILSSNIKNNISSITFEDELYPLSLRETIDFPLVLNYKGNISGLAKNSLAIIGTREPTAKGYKASLRFGEIFGELDFNVVSGLAKGCDTGGHQGCLNKNGYTTGVLAHGLDQIYPKENAYLAENILSSGGLLLSEYNVGQKPLSNYFIERDRIQAGISNGILIVETGISGGTMHTVNFAMKLNKIIGAYHNDSDEFLNSQKTQGNLRLIQDNIAQKISTPVELDDFRNRLEYTTKLNSTHPTPLGPIYNSKNDDIQKQLNLFE